VAQTPPPETQRTTAATERASRRATPRGQRKHTAASRPPSNGLGSEQDTTEQPNTAKRAKTSPRRAAGTPVSTQTPRSPGKAAKRKRDQTEAGTNTRKTSNKKKNSFA
jgi:hypothetical protein